ncbi:MAG: DUF3486 family protein [Sphingomonas sp.]|uniref:phage protein Gp27 family protein n=1 Tax=Sphingomonas sp. TaxID=28214 RepID=UPI002600044B|nr:phage protein Gp27 family protein [Sphingomonas sp.]MBX9881234.1 DUF3486 family protein [Sphingomonas sp.]
MGRRSSIEQLDPRVRAEVDQAIKRGATIDAIVDLLKGLGADASRSAVGRYSKRYAELARQQREMRTVAEAFGQEFGSADDRQGRMMVQLLTSVITRAIMPVASAEDDPEGIDAKELHFLARAVKDTVGAAKLDVERERAVREEERKRAAEAGADAARKGGASAETIDLVKRSILGLA